jgi:chemotaxis protein methyltransferase CheR
MLASGDYPEEVQIMVDLLTTNETYFFREPQHFQFLRDEIVGKRRGPGTFRVWSAASSSGEEAYSIAMTLAEAMDTPWEIVGSDISTQVLERAVTGHYSLARTEGIPPGYMRKYCLKGVRSHAGSFLIAPELRQKIRFYQINLMHPVDADIGEFDVILQRNVMIYFDPETKTRVVHNLLPRLKTGGHLIIGHSETLNGITERVVSVRPTIYRKP